MPDEDAVPAFPTGDHPESQLYASPGMSLRDYFAAKAMQALITNAGTDLGLRAEAASHAYGFADDMLIARSA